MLLERGRGLPESPNLHPENHMIKTHLEEITIDGYRSCMETTFRPNKSLSGLIGINGAGKTNILNALRLLNPDMYVRVSRTRNEEPTLPKTILTATFRVGDKKIRLRLTLILSNSGGNEEVVSAAEEWNFQDFDRSRAWVEFPSILLQREDRHSAIERIMYLSHASKGKNKTSPYQQIASIMSNDELLSAVQSVITFRTQIKYYGASQFTDPTRCPSSFEIDGEGKLERTFYSRPTPSHLQFLYDLYLLRKTDPTLYHEYEMFVSTKMLGLVSRLSWKPVRLSSNTVEIKSGGSIKKVRQYKTLVIPKVQIGTSHITFNQLSEGTFKTLALIFYIMTDKGSCLLIEEPEVCIHHGLLRRILSTIKAHSKQRQVIFSTHSDLVLDTISINEVFVVDMKKSITKVSSLSDWAGKDGISALNAYLNETGTLGDYWRSGGLLS